MKQHLDRYPRPSPFKRIMAGIAAWSVLVGQLAPVMALPTGASVRSGTVSFEESAGNLRVLQETDRAIVHYSSFNIGASEAVEFVQPGSSSAILNRIGGGSPSDILGSLSANGKVYLINPNGIIFGSSARVNVGGLVASSFDISDSDFASGTMRFKGGGGSVVNRGSISAGSFAYLVGGTVDNSGSISAGSVVLAAGQNSVVIDRAAGGEIRLVIDEVESAVDASTGAAAEDAAAEPDAGTAPAPAGTTDLLADPTVVNYGVIQSGEATGGEVALQAANVGQFGTILADGLEGDGGRIALFADNTVSLSADSVTTANAGLAGDGGSIEIVGENFLRLATGARIEARGGSESGDGGFVETSGKRGFVIGSAPDVGADNGKAGTWLIDPYNIEITAGTGYDGMDTTGDTWVPDGMLTPAQISVGTIKEGLINAGFVKITTTPDPDAGNEEGNITWLSDADITWDTAASLELKAHGNITIGGTVTAASGSLTLIADLENNNVGDITLNNLIKVGTLTMKGNSINQTGGSLTVGGATDLTGGTITLEQANVLGAITVNDGSGDVSITEDDAINVAKITRTTGSVTLNASVGDITIGEISTPNNVTLTATAGSILDDADDDVTDVTGNIVTMTAASGVGEAAGNGSLDTKANSLAVSVKGAGLINISEADDVTLADVDTFNGAITIAAGGTITVGTVTSGEGDGATLGAVTLTAGNAAKTAKILDDANDAAVDITGSAVTLTADAGVGAEGNSLDTAADSLDVSVTSAGLINISEADDVTLADVDTFNGAITIGAGGDIRVGTVTSGKGEGATLGAVTLTAGNAAKTAKILDDASDAAVDITGSAVTLTADAGVGADGDSLDTKANSLDVSVTSAGLINISEADDVTLADVDTLDGSITIAAGGTIKVGTVTSGEGDGATLGAVTLTARNAAKTAKILDDGDADDNVVDITGSAVTLAADAGVGAEGNSLDTKANSLDVSVTSAGLINISEADDVTLADVDTADGSITVTAGGTITATDVASLTDKDGNDITLTASSGDIVVGTVTAGATHGDVTLTSTAGSIKQGDATAQVTGTDVKLTAGTTIGATDARLGTKAGTIEFTAGGNVYITEADGVTVAGKTTANNGLIDIKTTGGTLTVGAVGDQTGLSAHGSGSVTLVAQGDDSDVEVKQKVSSGSGKISVTAADAVSLDEGLTTGGGKVTVTATGGDVTSKDAGTIKTTAAANSGTASGAVDVNAGGAVNLAGAITTAGAANNNGAGSDGGTVTVTTTDGAVTLAAVTTSGGASTSAGANGGNAGNITVTSGDAGDDATHDISLSGTLTALGGAAGPGGTDGTDGMVVLNADGAIIDQQNDKVGHDDEGFAKQTASPPDDDRVVNIAAGQLKLTAKGDIGAAGNPLDITVDTLAAQSANGSIYLYETDALTIGTVDGLSGVTADNHAKVETIDGTLTVDQAVKATKGDVLLAANDQTPEAAPFSDVILKAGVTAGGNVTVLARDSVEQKVVLDANDKLQSQGDITAGGTIDVQAYGGSIVMETRKGKDASDQAAWFDTVSQTQGKNIRYEAKQDVKLGVLDARTAADRASGKLDEQANWGDVAVVAGGSISDARTDTVEHEADGFAKQNGDKRTVNVFAEDAAFTATAGSVGQAGNPLDTEVATLAASATADGGSIYLYESTGVKVDNVAFAGVNRVRLDSDTTAVVGKDDLGGLAAGNHAKLETIDGDLTVDQAVKATKGDVLLAANDQTPEAAPFSDVILKAGVTAGGNVTVLARDSVEQKVVRDANDKLQSQGDITAGGTIDVQAYGGSIVMETRKGKDASDQAAWFDTVSQTQGKNIRYEAKQDVKLGVLDARTAADRASGKLDEQANWGDVAVVAGGGISDARTDTVEHEADGFAKQNGDKRTVNVFAEDAAFTATAGSVGQAGNPLDTEVATLAASATADGGSIYLYESTGVKVDNVAFAGVNRVRLDSDTTAVVGKDDLGGLAAGNHAKLETIDGDLTVDQAVKATKGDVLLAANDQTPEAAPFSDVILKAGVTAGGNVTVLARDSVEQKVVLDANDKLQSQGDITAGGTIDVQAYGGSIVMETRKGKDASDQAAWFDTVSQTQGKNIRYEAKQDVKLGVLDARTAADRASGKLDEQANWGDVAVVAGGSISDARTDTVEHEADGFAKQNGDKRTVNVFAEDAAFTATAGSVGQAGNPLDTEVATLAASAKAGGSIYLYESTGVKVDNVAFAGVNRVRLDSDTTAVVGKDDLGGLAAGNHAKLETIDGDLTVNKPVKATKGDVLLAAKEGDLTIDAAVDAGRHAGLIASGKVDENKAVSAGESKTVQAGGDVVINESGNARDLYYTTGGDITIKTLITADNSVALDAGGDIIHGQLAEKDDIKAQNILLLAGGDIGEGNRVVTDADTLAARAGGSISLLEKGDVNIASPGVMVKVPQLDSTTRDVGANASGIQAGGELDLEIEGNANANTIAAGGNADVNVGGSLDAGTITVGRQFNLDSGDFSFDRLRAGSVEATTGNIRMGDVQTGSARFDSSGNITYGNGTLRASRLEMTARGSIGANNRPLMLDVGTIGNARAGRDLYLREVSGDMNIAGQVVAGNHLQLEVPAGNIVDADNDGRVPINSIGPGNADVVARTAKLDARKVGTAANPLEVSIAGMLTLDSTKAADKNDPGYLWVHINGRVGKGALDIEYGEGRNVPGLIIYNGQLVGGDAALLRQVFRAEAFIVETPELRSRQGVFGNPFFVHTDLDVAEATALGLFDFLMAGRASIIVAGDEETARTLIDWDVDQLLISAAIDPPGLRRLYVRNFYEEAAQEKAAKEQPAGNKP